MGKWIVVKIDGRKEYVVSSFSSQDKAQAVANELSRNGGTYVVRKRG